MSVPCLFWPVTVIASQMVFRLERNPTGVPGNTTTNTTVTAGTYVNPVFEDAAHYLAREQALPPGN